MATEVQAQTEVPVPTADVVPEAAVPVDAAESSLYTYVFIAVLSVMLVLLLYYAYDRFVKNASKEPMRGVKQERDDPVVDFNLREAIKDLQNMQKNVMTGLSDVADV